MKFRIDARILHSISHFVYIFSRKSQSLLLFIRNNQDLIALIVEFIHIVTNIMGIKLNFTNGKIPKCLLLCIYFNILMIGVGCRNKKKCSMISQRFHYSQCGLSAMNVHSMNCTIETD